MRIIYALCLFSILVGAIGMVGVQCNFGAPHCCSNCVADCKCSETGICTCPDACLCKCR